MTNEKKSDDELIDESMKFDEDDEGLLSDFHDLFPEEDDDDELNEFASNTQDDSPDSENSIDELDELNNILDDFEQKLDSNENDTGLDESEIIADSELDDEVDDIEISTDNDDIDDFDLNDLQISVDEDSTEDEDVTDSYSISSDSEPAEIEPEIDAYDFDEANEADEADEVEDFEDFEADENEVDSDSQAQILDGDSADDDNIEEEIEESDVPDNDEFNEIDQVIAASTSTLDTNSISNLGIPKETPFVHKPESKGTSILTTIAIAVSLIIGAGGAFLAFTTSTTLQQTQTEIAQFKQSGGSITGQSDPRISKLFTAVDQINTRLNELSIMVDGPISHMNESGSATDNTTHMKLQELAKHVAMIDQVIAGLESQQDKLADSMTTTSHTKTTVAVKPVSASPSADSKGRWALNLQSLSDMKNAERTVQELKDIGVSSVVRKSDHTDHVWYRVRIEGFQTYNEAKEYIKKLPESPLTANTWVTNN